MRNVYLFQPQYHGKIDGITRAWLPYSVGCLWAYAINFPDITSSYQLGKFFFKRDKFTTVLDQLDDPVYCAFSCYEWNEQYNLRLAKEIKTRYPNCFIQFGGPQVSIADYINLDYIDQIVLSEGEQTFVNTLRALLTNTAVQRIPEKVRMQTLNNLPSPYSSGVFNSLIEEYSDHYFSAVLETNRGCPFQCTFCDWGSLTYSKIKKFDLSRVEADLHWFIKSRVINVMIADANFGIFAERDMQIAKLIKKVCYGSCVEYVGVTFTKNTTEQTFQIAKEMNPLVKAITISMQSMSDNTLKAIKRDNLKINNLKTQLSFAEKYNIPSYSEMIVGLPEETLDSWKTGLTDLIEAGQHYNIEIYSAILIRNSEMNSQVTKLKYKIKSSPVYDFMQYSTNDDDSMEAIKEISYIVQSTSTMSTDDIVQAHCYSWAIINTHIAGHSQIIAKYVRNVLGVSYRKFYDELYENLIKSEHFKLEYEEFKNTHYDLLTKGSTQLQNTNNMSILNHMVHYHFSNFYLKKQLLKDIVIATGNTFGPIPKAIQSLQDCFVFDNSQELPIEITVPWNIETWHEQECVYQVTGKIKHLDINHHNIIWNRKKNTLKNHIDLLQ